jgi:hypothetical protein
MSPQMKLQLKMVGTLALCPPYDLLATRRWITGSSPVMTREDARQFNTRLASGLSSEKVGTSISNFSPLSLTIW